MKLKFGMGAKFHIAMFCSSAVYDSKVSFYTKVFGIKPSHQGPINEGEASHEYEGSCWDCRNGTLFALLKNSDVTGTEEKLAHLGFFFDSVSEFEAAIKKRGIDKKSVKDYPDMGVKQVFKQDEDGIEWEFTYQPSGK